MNEGPHLHSNLQKAYDSRLHGKPTLGTTGVIKFEVI